VHNHAFKESEPCLSLKAKSLAVLALVILYIVLLTPATPMGIHSVTATSTEDTYIKLRKIAIVGVDSGSHLTLINITYVDMVVNLTALPSSCGCSTANVCSGGVALNVSVDVIANLTIDKDSRLLFGSIRIYNDTWSYTIYRLLYSTSRKEYNLTVLTTIYTNASSGEYGFFLTAINIQPTPKKASPIADAVVVVNSTKLSDFYRIVASTLRKYLNDNESEWLWNKVAVELEKLSKIVEDRLGDYNKPAEGLAIVMDFDLLNCLAAVSALLYRIVSLIGTPVAGIVAQLCPLCVQVVTCIPACATIFTAWTCLACIGMGLIGCAACLLPLGLCAWAAVPVLQYCT